MPDANEQVPRILDLPIGLNATGMRQEFDSLGRVEVPANRYWGAQTQRSLQPVGRAALIASVGGQRGWADWANPEHRLRRLLAEFIGMAGLTFVLSGARPSWSATGATRCNHGRPYWCSLSSRHCGWWRPSTSSVTSLPISTRR